MSNSMTPVSRRHILIGGAAMVAVTGIPLTVFAGQSKTAGAPARQRKNQGEGQMNTIPTKDQTTIFYKDWGTGPTVVFSHGWPLNADAWDPQMLSWDRTAIASLLTTAGAMDVRASPGMATTWTHTPTIWERCSTNWI
jgi:hypothetical protein